MKLVNKIALISVLCITAVFGVGLAAWTFSTNKSATLGTTGLVTELDSSAGTVVYLNNAAEVSAIYLILDQSSAHGIYWSTVAFTGDNEAACYAARITALTVKYTGKAGQSPTAYHVDFTKTTEALASNSYIQVATAGSVGWTTDDTTGSAYVGTATYTLPVLSYSAEPQNATQLAAMKTALEDLNPIVNISITATVTDGARS